MTNEFTVVLKCGEKIAISQEEINILSKAMQEGKTHQILRNDKDNENIHLFFSLHEIASIYGPTHHIK